MKKQKTKKRKMRIRLSWARNWILTALCALMLALASPNALAGVSTMDGAVKAQQVQIDSKLIGLDMTVGDTGG